MQIERRGSSSDRLTYRCCGSDRGPATLGTRGIKAEARSTPRSTPGDDRSRPGGARSAPEDVDAKRGRPVEAASPRADLCSMLLMLAGDGEVGRRSATGEADLILALAPVGEEGMYGEREPPLLPRARVVTATAPPQHRAPKEGGGRREEGESGLQGPATTVVGALAEGTRREQGRTGEWESRSEPEDARGAGG
jgi:hypothetical protein